MKKYDIFISYRRDGGFETADAIYQRLLNAGYSVFLDLEQLNAGKFNTKLLSVIEQCKDFIIVLPDKGLDRCIHEDDWVRLEIEHAIKHNKNIIPIMLRGFSWPEKLPESIHELPDYNGISAGDYNVFAENIQRLKERFLISKRGFTFYRYRTQIISFIALLILGLGIWGYTYYQARKAFTATCIEQSKIMSIGIAAINVNLNISNEVYQKWNEYTLQFSTAQSKDTARIRREFVKFLLFKQNAIIQRSNLETISDHSAQLLSRHGVQPEEIKAFYELALPGFAKEVSSYISSLLAYAQLPSIFDSINQYARLANESNIYHAKSDYYTLLGFFTTMPTDIFSEFKKIHPQLNNFSEIPLSLSFEDYEAQAQMMLKNFESTISELSGVVNEGQRVVESMQYKIDETLKDIGKAQTTQALVRVNEKRENLTIKEAELAEAEKRLAESYERALKKFAIEPQDDQWYMWGKVMRIGSLAQMASISRKKGEQEYKEQIEIAEKNGMDPSILSRQTYTYSLDDMFGNVDKWFSDYLSYWKEKDPNAQAYVKSARAYYKEIKKNALPFGGVIVVATQNDATHPVYRIGDILMERKGVKTNTPDKYTQQKDAPGDNIVKYYRLTERGKFQLHSEKIPDSDVLIGLVGLTEEE